MAEPTAEDELKEAHAEYGRRCTERGHIEAQIIDAEKNLDELRAAREKNIHEVKQLLKKAKELQTKVAFDKEKANASQESAA